MNWDQVLKNIGALSGFSVLIIVWLGQALWMRIEADKRGMWGWVWAFIGILTPPFGLFFFLFWRLRSPVRPEVSERDEVMEETSRTKRPFYEIMADKTAPPTPEPPNQAENIKAALEAEERRYGK